MTTFNETVAELGAPTMIACLLNPRMEGCMSNAVNGSECPSTFTVPEVLEVSEGARGRRCPCGVACARTEELPNGAEYVGFHEGEGAEMYSQGAGLRNSLDQCCAGFPWAVWLAACGGPRECDHASYATCSNEIPGSPRSQPLYADAELLFCDGPRWTGWSRDNWWIPLVSIALYVSNKP